MKQNIAIIGFKDEYKKQVAQMLASQLEMNLMDSFEMLLFDDKPRSLSETLKMVGSRRVRKHESSIIKYVSSFSNTLIVCDGGCVESRKNLDVLKSNCLLIYIHCTFSHVKKYLDNCKFSDVTEKRFFVKDDARIKKRIEIAKRESDIIVNATGQSVFKTTADVIREIKKYYDR